MRWRYITEQYRQALELPYFDVANRSTRALFGQAELRPCFDYSFRRKIEFEGAHYIQDQGAWTRSDILDA